MDDEKKNSNVIAKLSDREFRILKLLIQGNDHKQMAEDLGLTPQDIKTELRNILIKLSVTERTQAAIRELKAALAEDEG